MGLSDFVLHGAFRDLQQLTLLRMLERDRPREPAHLDEPLMWRLVKEALTEGATKSYRFKVLELALWNYNGHLSSPLERLLPQLLTEDQALAIDVVLDVWMRSPIEIVPHFVPYLETVHHPERLRQLIGAVANDLKDEVELRLPNLPLSPNAAERRDDRRMLCKHFASLGAGLQRWQSLHYRTDELPEFAAGVVLQLRRARDGALISERDCERLQTPFLETIDQPGRPDLAARARQRLTPSSPQ